MSRQGIQTAKITNMTVNRLREISKKQNASPYYMGYLLSKGYAKRNAIIPEDMGHYANFMNWSDLRWKETRSRTYEECYSVKDHLETIVAHINRSLMKLNIT